MNIQADEGKVAVLIDISELFQELSDEDKRVVAKFISFDTALIEAITKRLTTNEVDWHDDDDPPWYQYSTGKDSTCLEKVYKNLLPLMPEIIQQFIANLIEQRDTADKRCTQWQAHCWELQRVWRGMDRPPECDYDYGHVLRLTKEEVGVRIKEWERRSASKEAR